MKIKAHGRRESYSDVTPSSWCLWVGNGSQSPFPPFFFCVLARASGGGVPTTRQPVLPWWSDRERDSAEQGLVLGHQLLSRLDMLAIDLDAVGRA
ncbi:MAG TPA: hypothetical protein PK359_23800, partial [Burkholderiaceae bacterium]|nr:hypothetical protein [Burkholderiaceae bacterium]